MRGCIHTSAGQFGDTSLQLGPQIGTTCHRGKRDTLPNQVPPHRIGSWMEGGDICVNDRQTLVDYDHDCPYVVFGVSPLLIYVIASRTRLRLL